MDLVSRQLHRRDGRLLRVSGRKLPTRSQVGARAFAICPSLCQGRCRTCRPPRNGCMALQLRMSPRVHMTS